MKNSRLRMKMFFTSTLFALFSLAGFAGTITITPGSTNPTTVGAVYQNTFTATSTDPADLTSPVWKIDPADLPTAAYYQLKINASTGLMEGDPTPAHSTGPAGVTLHIIYTNTNTPATQEVPFTLVIYRNPVDLMLILDKSGSMGYSFDGTNLSAPNGSRRWDGLARGVSVLAQSLSNPDNQAPHDNIGLRYFESGVTLPGAPFDGGLVPTSTNLSALDPEVRSHGPGSNTALGDGIKAGKTILLPGNAGHRKVMIVFSDGVQNSGDLVKETDPGAYKTTQLNVDLSRAGTDTATINTICLGSSGDNPTLMEHIADSNGAGSYFNSLTGDSLDFVNNSFLGSIQHVLSGNSPEYVDVRMGSFKPDSASSMSSMKETFTVNKSVSSVFVVLTAANNLEPVIKSVMKDGVELIQYVHSASGQGYRSFYVNLPLTYLPAVKSEGDWTITASIRSATGAAAGASAYTISMTVEDPRNHITWSLNKNLKVGDTLHPAVSIHRLASVLGTATVNAIVIKPGDDINDLLARSDVKYTVTPGDSSTPNIYKLAELLKDSAFLAKIKAANRLVNLTYDPGTQTYTGSYPELDVAGVYRVLYTITNSDTNGVMKRYYLKSFNVRFKDVDLGASGVSVIIDSLTRNAVIIFRPVSSTGKYIGSGWGSSIGLQAQTAGLKIVSVEDLGDGSYKLHLSGPLSGDGVLTIANDTVYSGNLGDITKGGNGGGPGGSLFHHWWFWLLLLLFLLLIIWGLRKKNP